jgi:hypothetical protein
MSRHTFGFAVRAKIFFLFSQAPLSPSFYPHSLVSDIRSALGPTTGLLGVSEIPLVRQPVIGQVKWHYHRDRREAQMGDVEDAEES